MNSNSSYKSENAASPIVLLHGWGMNKNIWTPFIKSLPETVQRRIVALDLPGFGDNKFMPKHYDLEALSNWLNSELSKECEIDQECTLLGWSLGGLVAQHFASTYPEKVKCLGLIASSPKFMADSEWQGIKPDILAMFSDQLSQNHEQTIERFLAIQAMGAKSAKQDIKDIRDLVLLAPSPNLVALEQGLVLLQTVDLREQFSRLNIKSAGIFGRLDSLVPAVTALEMEKLNQNFEMTMLNKASHAPFISHIGQFSEWFNNFIN